jgi:hypothetical protein
MNTTNFDGCLENSPFREGLEKEYSGEKQRVTFYVCLRAGSDLRMKAGNRL